MPDKSGVRADRRGLGAGSGAAGASVVFVSPGTSLTNRSQLSSDLGLAVVLGDEAILLAAWAHWGDAMADRLRGDFAFAIHDPDRAILFLARDIFGRAPLYYHVDGATVVIAGSSRLVRAILGRPLARNEAFYADFVHGLFVEREESFFHGLKRLPPAHLMMVSRQEAEPCRYWSAGDIRQQSAMPDAADRFRRLFDGSVARAAAGERPVVLLSGGLDSSAILGSIMAEKAGDGPPDCLTKTYRCTNGWNDECYLDSLKARFGVHPHEVACDRHDPLGDMERWLDVLDGPYVSYGHSVASHLLDVAKDGVHRTLLSGHGGDEVVGYGMGRLNELARQRRWVRLWKEAGGMTALSGRSRLRVLRKYLTHYPRYRAFERRFQHRFPDLPSIEPQSLSDGLLAAVGPERYAVQAAIERSDHDEPMLHAEALDNPVQPLALETIGACSRAVGVETAMPFYDRDLVELTLSLPSDWKLRDGYSRYVLRRAMAGRLPEDVLRRRDKFDFTDAFVAGLVAHRDRVLALTADADRGLGDYANMPRLAAVRERLSRAEPSISGCDARFAWRCAVLAMWLARVETSLSSPDMVLLTERSLT